MQLIVGHRFGQIVSVSGVAVEGRCIAVIYVKESRTVITVIIMKWDRNYGSSTHILPPVSYSTHILPPVSLRRYISNVER